MKPALARRPTICEALRFARGVELSHQAVLVSCRPKSRAAPPLDDQDFQGDIERIVDGGFHDHPWVSREPGWASWIVFYLRQVFGQRLITVSQ